jgi:hypothetical protein
MSEKFVAFEHAAAHGEQLAEPKGSAALPRGRGRSAVPAEGLSPEMRQSTVDNVGSTIAGARQGVAIWQGRLRVGYWVCSSCINR